MKGRRHDTDDLVRCAVEPQRLSQDIRQTAKATLPEAVTDNHDGARVSVLWQECSTKCRGDTEQLEEIRRDRYRNKSHQRIQIEPVFRLTKVGRDRFAPDEVLSECVQLELRQGSAADALSRRDDSQQIIRIAERERPKDDGVNCREYGAVDADRGRDGQNEDDGHAPIPRRKQERWSQVLQQIGHHVAFSSEGCCLQLASLSTRYGVDVAPSAGQLKALLHVSKDAN
jgi:hypothetical protein